jgi:ureidoacrylate peracid hydrolase
MVERITLQLAKYLVTLVTDACTTTSAGRHEQSLIGIRGYCRQRASEAVISEIATATDPG